MLRRWMIGLGANLGDARGALERTLHRLRTHPQLAVSHVSSLYRSAPVDAQGPDFLNVVVALDSDLDPESMLAVAQSLESLEGRERPYRNSPRTLDVDLLTAGDLTLAQPQLTLPHPRMHERAFVLTPLLEIDPDAHIAGRGRAADWLQRCLDQSIERLDRLDAQDDTEAAGDARRNRVETVR